MNCAQGVAQLDAQPMHLCPVCLRKLHVALLFNPVQRYRELRKFYAEAVGLQQEAAWLQCRLQAIEAGWESPHPGGGGGVARQQQLHQQALLHPVHSAASIVLPSSVQHGDTTGFGAGATSPKRRLGGAVAVRTSPIATTRAEAAELRRRAGKYDGEDASALLFQQVQRPLPAPGVSQPKHRVGTAASAPLPSIRRTPAAAAAADDGMQAGVAQPHKLQHRKSHSTLLRASGDDIRTLHSSHSAASVLANARQSQRQRGSGHGGAINAPSRRGGSKGHPHGAGSSNSSSMITTGGSGVAARRRARAAHH